MNRGSIRNSLTAICYVVSLVAASASWSQTPSEIQKELRDTVSLWAEAWSSQIPEDYFDFYAEQYYPSAYTSRSAWIENRTNRIQGPESIRIRLFDFEIQETDLDRAIVRFMLIYERPGYSDQTLKELTLVKVDNQWRIIWESNLSIEILD